MHHKILSGILSRDNGLKIHEEKENHVLAVSGKKEELFTHEQMYQKLYFQRKLLILGVYFSWLSCSNTNGRIYIIQNFGQKYEES